MKLFKHTNHTALEFLKATGQEAFELGGASYKAEDLFGKFLIRIGGVVVNESSHLLGIADADSVEVIVGNVRFSAPVEDSDESQTILTEDAQKAIELKAKRADAQNKRLEAVKEFMEILRNDPEASFTADEGDQKDLDEVVAEAKKQLAYEKSRLESEATK